jgi:hypothetical protein
MKRCPQCEFIYEDDQSLCDMDGILLVFDSQQLPKHLQAQKSKPRSRIVPLVAGIVLTTVLALVYYVATHQRKPTQVVDSSSPVTAAQASSETKQAATSVPENKAITPEPDSEPKPTPTRAASDSKTNKSSRAQSTTPAQKNVSANNKQENDSKIESFMKKTGKILKKPFKL